MFFYLISPIVLLVILFAYFRIADYFNIIDKPNERSSHSVITIRGGGVIFPIAVLLWFLVYCRDQYWLLFALVLISAISFLDDILTLSSKIRILIHFTAVTILFWQLQVLELPWYMIVLAYLFTIGWINAFNFMDGINGITALYGIVALISFAGLNLTIGFVSQKLIIVLLISVLIFAFFNARKRAKVFAGDVGSVSLSFLLSWLMIALMVKTGRIEYILFFTVYGIDSVFTIIFRLIRRENIFKAHRSHLYQLLSNELKWSHVKVSAIYCIIQALINATTIYLIIRDKMTLYVFLFIVTIASVCYLIVRYSVSKIVRRNISSNSLKNK